MSGAWVAMFALGAAALACCTFAGYLVGLFNGRNDIESRSYWRGFADGELHQQLQERTPSLN
jgi:hypothetical protein